MMLTRRALVCSATLALAGRPLAQERTRLVFATAGRGSAFLAFGKAVAPVVERYVPVAVEIRETKGSNENAELVGAGQVQIATLNMGLAHDAWNGQGPFARRQLRGFRALAPMYETPFHAIAVEESGITSFKALKGKSPHAGSTIGRVRDHGGPREVRPFRAGGHQPLVGLHCAPPDPGDERHGGHLHRR